MTVRDMERILIADGWTLKATRGSHMQYIHPTKPGKITIPNHGGDIPRGTLNSIMKQAGLKESGR